MGRALRLAVLTLVPFVMLAVEGDVKRGSLRLAAAAIPDAGGASDVFRALANQPGLQARFAEEKRLTVLVQPLKSEGTVHFDSAQGLARHTSTPGKQSVFLSRGVLSFFDGKKTEVVKLDRSPSLRAFADGFTMLLAGDRVGLERTFQIEFAGQPGGEWHMKMIPIAEALRKLVTSIDVQGKGDVLASLAVNESNGDVTTTRFYDVDSKKVYAPADPVFRVPDAR